MQFYALERFPRGDADTCYGKEEGYNQGATVSMLTWMPPFRVTLELHGKEFGDFAFAPGADDFLVTQEFRDVYCEHKLSGLSGFDLVEVLGVKPRRKQLPKRPAYFRVSVSYGVPALDMMASGFQWHEPPKCTYCREASTIRWERLVLEAAKTSFAPAVYRESIWCLSASRMSANRTELQMHSSRRLKSPVTTSSRG